MTLRAHHPTTLQPTPYTLHLTVLIGSTDSGRTGVLDTLQEVALRTAWAFSINLGGVTEDRDLRLALVNSRLEQRRVSPREVKGYPREVTDRVRWW